MLDANYLNNLLNSTIVNQNQLTFDLYLTLLTLNNNYQFDNYQTEINILEDFLRKVNNLKVKIQLKRKENEINEFLDSIKTIYEQNKRLIEKYNLENIDIINTLESKDPESITNIIDKLTKLKMDKISKKERYNKIRNIISNNIFNTDYHIDNEYFYMDNLTIELSEFYDIFDYLLDINNYKEVYHNEISNTWRTNLITSIIKSIEENTPLDDYLPIALTNLFSKALDSSDIDMTKFNIENIKITELYSFPKNTDNTKTAKWKNVTIPSDYLYNKIKLMVSRGMYYQNNNIFTMELINDFKISILRDDLIIFLKENINKHIFN